MTHEVELRISSSAAVYATYCLLKDLLAAGAMGGTGTGSCSEESLCLKKINLF